MFSGLHSTPYSVAELSQVKVSKIFTKFGMNIVIIIANILFLTLAVINSAQPEIGHLKFCVFFQRFMQICRTPDQNPDSLQGLVGLANQMLDCEAFESSWNEARPKISMFHEETQSPF